MRTFLALALACALCLFAMPAQARATDCHVGAAVVVNPFVSVQTVVPVATVVTPTVAVANVAVVNPFVVNAVTFSPDVVVRQRVVVNSFNAFGVNTFNVVNVNRVRRFNSANVNVNVSSRRTLFGGSVTRVRVR